MAVDAGSAFEEIIRYLKNMEADKKSVVQKYFK